MTADPTALPSSPPPSLVGQVLTQSWPASLSMLSTTVTRFVDGLMIAHVGAAAMNAQQIGGMTAFVPEALMIGLLAVVNTYVSQNLGAGRLRQCASYAWAAVLMAVAAATLVTPTIFLIRHLFARMPTSGESFVAMQTLYYRYMVLGIWFTLPSRALDQFFYGVHRPRVVLTAAVVANLVNVACNYVLIFGKLGLPALGLEGAALGSLISWVVQLAILTSVFFSPAMHRRYHTRRGFHVAWRHMGDILRIGWPSGVQFCNQVLVWQLFMTQLVGSFGHAHLAGSIICIRYSALAFMPTVGIGIATTALVGKLIGQGRKAAARRAARGAVAVAVAYAGLCGLAFWLFRDPMIRPFLGERGRALTAQQAEILRVARVLLLMAAVFQLFDAVRIVYNGALRGTGDTRWPMAASISLSWLLTLGGGWAMVHLAGGLGAVGPWVAASLYGCVLGVLLGWRFASGAWERIDLLGVGEAFPEDSPALPDSVSARPERAPDDGTTD